MSLPDSIRKVFIWLAETYKTKSLTKVADSTINFETRIQNPIPVIMQTIKFTPPTVDDK